MNPNKPKCLFVAVLITAFAACSTVPGSASQVTKNKTESTNTTAEIEALYYKGEYETALLKLFKLRETSPSGRLAPDLENLSGLSCLGLKHPKEALIHFKKAVENENNTRLKAYYLYNLATAQLKAEQLEDAQKTIKIIDPSMLDTENKHKLSQLKTLIQPPAPLPPQSPPPSNYNIDISVNKNIVGVLLPTKGKFAKFGNRVILGIQMALRVFNLSEPASQITLVIEDSGEEPEHAIAALNKLVLKYHALAVIGPLLSKGIEQVRERAQELGVPMISLAKYMGKPMGPKVSSSEYFIDAGLSLKTQIEELAKYAVHKLGLRKFAILTPGDKTGAEARSHFWNTIEAEGGVIVGVDSYSTTETDFRQSVDKLSGLYYLEARQRELDDLAKERETNKIRKRTRKTEQFFNLKPVVDYEAVFIADSAKTSGQILPTFAYRDVEGIKFLGTSLWNSPDLPSRAQNSAEQAIFVDFLTPDTASTSSNNFNVKFKDTFGQEPFFLEAIAYDASRILESAMTNGGFDEITIGSRKDLLEKLKTVRNFSGLNGQVSYHNGTFHRNLRVLTVQNGQIITVP
ncbi:MAG: penicillin-binding protein activator [Bdellovibrionota bacterium]